ncbi:MAG: M48 family metalloprotease [Deltaproteobacteria bacterium]|nr:M48 family metalloprotease [Deltaproteobacteria bacterium]
MFNNIIYFIVVLLIFNISYQETVPKESLAYTVLMLSTTWVVFGVYCRLGFQRLEERAGEEDERGRSPVAEYHGLVLRLSILAIFLFALDVYLFHLKYWVQIIPGFRTFSVLQGLAAIGVFLGYLVTIWYFSHSAYVAVFHTVISRKSLIISNFRLNAPILFPWFAISLIYDFISLATGIGSLRFFATPAGELIFFAAFLVLLMVFLPLIIQYFWGCRPFAPSQKVREVENFLREKGFKYRGLLRWSVFEGRMMTAGIMGFLPRFRYILITDSLMEMLGTEELKAVVAHEMGHAKYRHMFLYFFFFLGFVVLSFGLFDIFFYSLATQPYFSSVIGGSRPQGTSLFYLLLSIPILLSIFFYFRYLMGFFMRHFERQADLYSARVMGTPRPTISSLEKIAMLSGKIRDLPSWHHFSIKQRVETLWRLLEDPSLAKRHSRFVAVCFSIYLVCMIGAGYFLDFSPQKEMIILGLVAKSVEASVEKNPQDIELTERLAFLYHEAGKYNKAIKAYEKVIKVDKNRAIALNNLAWLLVTVPEKRLRDPACALVLAERAVALQKSPIFLDTLAEALYANGRVAEAVRAAREALSLARERKSYYEKQLKRFSAHPGGKNNLP